MINKETNKSRDVFRCPACGVSGHVLVLPHEWFDRDEIALKCQSCKHVWGSGLTTDRVESLL